MAQSSAPPETLHTRTTPTPAEIEALLSKPPADKGEAWAPDMRNLCHGGLYAVDGASQGWCCSRVLVRGQMACTTVQGK
jgi:hypothetical protein